MNAAISASEFLVRSLEIRVGAIGRSALSESVEGAAPEREAPPVARVLRERRLADERRHGDVQCAEAIEVAEVVCLLYGANEAQERRAGRVHLGTGSSQRIRTQV